MKKEEFDKLLQNSMKEEHSRKSHPILGIIRIVWIVTVISVIVYKNI